MATRKSEGSPAAAQQSRSTGAVKKRIQAPSSKSEDVSSEGNVDYCTDIISSDSDDSSIDLLFDEILTLQNEEMSGKTEKHEEVLTEEEEKLERMAFYSIYLGDDDIVKRKPESKPLYSEGYKNFQPYTVSEAYMKDQEAQQLIMHITDEEEFQKFLSSGIERDFRLDDIDENVSIRTIAEKNFKTLKMNGPTRKIALIFDYELKDGENISNEFRDFMNDQIEKLVYVGGALLLCDEIGIQIVEASEYTHLLLFPEFFSSAVYKKLKSCKVLGIEELSAMKSFKQYACYKASPPKQTEPLKSKLTTHEVSIKFMKKLGKCLNIFLKFAYNDKPNIFEDNKVPENIEAELPSKEYLMFILNGDWTPGLRGVEKWYYSTLVLTTEADDAEFVWPPRSDHFPVHELHPIPEEEKKCREIAREKMKNVKLPGKKKVKEIKKKPIKKIDDEEYFLDIFLTEENQIPTVEYTEGMKFFHSESSLNDSDPDTEYETYLDHIEGIRF